MDESLISVSGMDNSMMSNSTRNSVFYESSNMNSSAFLGTDTSLGVSVIRRRL
jgi:hypothetical protein